MKVMLDACASFNPPPSDDRQLAVNPPWPQLLAVEEIKGAFGGLYAMRWELRSNGRATFQWTINERAELWIKFRRIGYADIAM
jgi:hypothetical protein